MDDSFITYRYARNLVNGKGFTFNEGERVQGTTTPLFTLAIAASLLVEDDARTTGAILSLVGLLGTGLLIVVLFRRRGYLLVGTVTAAMMVTSRLSLTSVTMETALYVALIVLFLVLKYAGYDLAASVVAPLAFLTRFDGILLYPLAAVSIRDGRPRPYWLGSAVVCLPTVAWLAFAQLYFGSVLPNTFFAKAHGGASVWTDNGFLHGIHYWIEGLALGESAALFALWILAAIFGLGLELSRKRWGAYAAFWSLVYVFGYTVVNPPYEFSWYQVPTLAAVLILQGFAAQAVQKTIRSSHRPRRLAAQLTFGLWLVISVYVCGQSMLGALRQGDRPPPPHIQAYTKMASYLRQHAAPTARVAAAEIGIIGYESDLAVIDLAGLVSPENRALIRTLGWRFAVARILTAEVPEYMVLNVDGGWSTEIRSNAEFMGRYREVMRGRKGKHRLVLYERSE